jgi:hypothetical protein
LMLKEDKTKKDKSSLPTKRPAAHPRNGRSSTLLVVMTMVPKDLVAMEETSLVRMTILV